VIAAGLIWRINDKRAKTPVKFFKSKTHCATTYKRPIREVGNSSLISAVQILDEVLYPIAEKLIEKDALSPEQATANMPVVEGNEDENT
jgi:hypothetical protein